jgi:hypothetical protein
MASTELLRLRAFARGDPSDRGQAETAARIRAQSTETIRTCRATVSDSRALLAQLKAYRATREAQKKAFRVPRLKADLILVVRPPCAESILDLPRRERTPLFG